MDARALAPDARCLGRQHRVHAGHAGRREQQQRTKLAVQRARRQLRREPGLRQRHRGLSPATHPRRAAGRHELHQPRHGGVRGLFHRRLRRAVWRQDVIRARHHLQEGARAGGLPLGQPAGRVGLRGGGQQTLLVDQRPALQDQPLPAGHAGHGRRVRPALHRLSDLPELDTQPALGGGLHRQHIGQPLRLQARGPQHALRHAGRHTRVHRLLRGAGARRVPHLLRGRLRHLPPQSPHGTDTAPVGLPHAGAGDVRHHGAVLAGLARRRNHRHGRRH